MATTPIIPGNVYVTTGSISGDTITHSDNKAVEIWSDKIDYDYQNEVGNIPIPIPKGSRTSKSAQTRARDLKLITVALTVAGHLADDGDDATLGSANAKRNNLIDMMNNEGGLKVVWGPDGNFRTLFGDTETNKAFITKMTFTETSGHQGEGGTSDPEPERKIDITISFIIGKDL